eukprot:7373558-Prymnesium_polylepis.1
MHGGADGGGVGGAGGTCRWSGSSHIRSSTTFDAALASASSMYVWGDPLMGLRRRRPAQFAFLFAQLSEICWIQGPLVPP